MNTFREFFNTLEAALTLKAKELETGITLIDAVQADAFETELRMLVGPIPEDHERVRRMALDLVKAGITEDEIPTLIRRARSGPIMTVYELEKLRQYVTNTIDNIKNREGIQE